MKKKLLLTGSPRVGKTTIIQKIVVELHNVGGFYTREIREKNKRVGFEVITLYTKNREILSHINFKSCYKVGRYKVNVKGFEQVIQAEINESLKKNVSLLVLDEIGKMEIFSSYFCKIGEELLKGDIPILGVIPLKRNTFLEGVCKLPEIVIKNVTIENRELILKEVKDWVNKILFI